MERVGPGWCAKTAVNCGGKLTDTGISPAVLLVTGVLNPLSTQFLIDQQTKLKESLAFWQS